MGPEEVTDQTGMILKGMVQSFGEHSRLVGASIEVIDHLADRVLELPNRKQFVMLAIAVSGGVLLSVILAATALAVALAS